jgi:rhamnosyltransferase
MEESICALIVCYNSDLDRLEKSLRLLTGQSFVIVVDNSDVAISSGKIELICHSFGALYLSMGGNCGIAEAQNVGIEIARKRGAKDLLLMDDDSLPTPTLVRELLLTREAIHGNFVVVSARTIDECGRDVSNCAPVGLSGVTLCSQLTSSGALIPMAVFDAVGVFDDKLFIDCVDFEWGWRAVNCGVSLFLCDRVAIQHRLGTGSRFGLRFPSPVRHYYQYRNILKMIFQSKAPLSWRASQLIKLPVKLILIVILADFRIIRVRFAALGIWDFLRGRFGKLKL